VRTIKNIVVHCSATRPEADIGAAEIRRWHVEDNGWRDVGYHYIIRRDGRVEAGRPVEQPGAHVAGHNADSLGLCLVGGLDANGRSAAEYAPAQWAALRRLLGRLKERFPEADILGHRDFPGVAKDCPCFDVRRWLAGEGNA
jgi:N-acetyl-anhydromuramyl-L-alanine amidase AmpD